MLGETRVICVLQRHQYRGELRQVHVIDAGGVEKPQHTLLEESVVCRRQGYPQQRPERPVGGQIVIARVDGCPELLHCLRQVALLTQHCPQLGVQLGDIRFDVDSPTIGAGRAIEIALCAQSIAKIIECKKVVRIALQRRVETLHRLRRLAQLRESEAETAVRFHIVREKGNGLAIGGGGAGEIASTLKGVPQVAMKLRHLARCCDGPAQKLGGLPMVPVLEHHGRQQIEGIGLLGMDFEDTPVGLMGAFQVAAAMQRKGGIEQQRQLFGQYFLQGRIAGGDTIAYPRALCRLFGYHPQSFTTIGSTGRACMQLQIEGLDVLTVAIVVIFLGRFLTTHIPVLQRYNIPPAVTGGLLCSILTALVYFLWDTQITFDLALRDLLLLFFFSTIGLSAKLRQLAEGGKTIAILVMVAAAMLVAQDVVGVGTALLLGGHPGYGLFAGSISFAGGHGTAIAWGAEASAAGLQGAAEFGIACATFGLVAGGIIGGPYRRMADRKTFLIPHYARRRPERATRVRRGLSAGHHLECDGDAADAVRLHRSGGSGQSLPVHQWAQAAGLPDRHGHRDHHHQRRGSARQGAS